MAATTRLCLSVLTVGMLECAGPSLKPTTPTYIT